MSSDVQILAVIPYDHRESQSAFLSSRPVLVRIVRLSIHPEEIDSFLEVFDNSAPKIRAFPGCEHLELWRDLETPAVCTTYSHWSDAEALETYRKSDLFRSTWATVKPLFDASPEAHSYSVARTASSIERAANSLDTKDP